MNELYYYILYTALYSFKLLYKSAGKCLTPSSRSCSPRDNDPLVLGDCTEKHFQFSFGSDGVLRHSCSGKMVCPGRKTQARKVSCQQSMFSSRRFIWASRFFSFFIAIVITVCLVSIIFWLSFSFAPAPLYLMTTLLKNTPSKCQHW